MKTNATNLMNDYFESRATRKASDKNKDPGQGNINDSRPELDVKMMTHYPDPFQQRTSIVFKLAQPSLVSLVIYNPEFRGMHYVACGYRDKGYHRVQFDASHLPAGVYVARLRTEQGIVKEYLTKLSGPELA